MIGIIDDEEDFSQEGTHENSLSQLPDDSLFSIEDDDEGIFFETSAEKEGLMEEEISRAQRAIIECTKKPTKTHHPDQNWRGVPSATVYMPFGKHHDKIPWDIDPDYLAWACRTIPLYFYSFYLPRFTQEAGKKWINWWEKIYGQTLDKELKESRINLRPNGKDYQDVTQEIQETLQNHASSQGTLCQLVPVKARKNIFHIQGYKKDIIHTLKTLLEKSSEETFQEITILCATQSPNNKIEVEFLHRKYQPTK